MRSATIPLTPSELQELGEIARRKYNGRVWDYFRQVERVPRPYVHSDFVPSSFIPDL